MKEYSSKEYTKWSLKGQDGGVDIREDGLNELKTC